MWNKVIQCDEEKLKSNFQI